MTSFSFVFYLRRATVSRAGMLGLIVAAMMATPTRCRALEPREVALVAAQHSRESQALARYYCKVRGVPVENICIVDVPPGEVLPRAVWADSVRPAIRRWLEENDPQRRIRCLTTMWDVPLKISPTATSTAADDYRSVLAGERDARMLLMKQIAAELEALATGEAVDPPTALRAPDTLAVLKNNLELQLQAAQQALAGASDDETQSAKRGRLQQLATVTGGLRVLLQGLQVEIERRGADVPEQVRTSFDLLRGRLIGYEEARNLVEQMAPGADRDIVSLAMLERSVGLLGAVDWLNEQIEIAKKNETGASFDSELSLVWWPDDYQLLRWQPNYLRADQARMPLRSQPTTLMVSRIDAPTLAGAKRLIDDAIAVEKAGGLKGKVYIDARGLGNDNQPASPGSYEDFDRSLRTLAEGLQKTTDFEVVLNSKPELFAAGECPDTALYCGWYSLANYVDAFDFNQGAVAVHLASAEATTLREKDAKNWCKRLLEDGACATIGPVYEPYLVAFPKPDVFFATLLRGDRTLVETYYQTKPFNSWMMVLVGDPLYRPFGPTPAELP